MTGTMMPPRGYTYTLSGKPYDGWAKIGRTGGVHPRTRLAACQTGNPRPLCLRAVWTIDFEKELHSTFREFRGCGEWFALPLPMLQHMARVAPLKNPLAALLMEWTPGKVWTYAGGRRAARTPDGLSRIFMSQAAKTNTLIREQEGQVIDLFDGANRPRIAHEHAR